MDFFCFIRVFVNLFVSTSKLTKYPRSRSKIKTPKCKLVFYHGRILNLDLGLIFWVTLWQKYLSDFACVYCHKFWAIFSLKFWPRFFSVMFVSPARSTAELNGFRRHSIFYSQISFFFFLKTFFCIFVFLRETRNKILIIQHIFHRSKNCLRERSLG